MLCCAQCESASPILVLYSINWVYFKLHTLVMELYYTCFMCSSCKYIRTYYSTVLYMYCTCNVLYSDWLRIVCRASAGRRHRTSAGALARSPFAHAATTRAAALMSLVLYSTEFLVLIFEKKKTEKRLKRIFPYPKSIIAFGDSYLALESFYQNSSFIISFLNEETILGK